jgi:hypothetical protein
MTSDETWFHFYNTNMSTNKGIAAYHTSKEYGDNNNVLSQKSYKNCGLRIKKNAYWLIFCPPEKPSKLFAMLKCSIN